MRKTLISIAIMLPLTVPIAALAQAPGPAPAATVNRLSVCKQIPAPAERLACYDAATTQLEQAIAAKTVVVMDREDVRKTRRSLFGFDVPKLPFFGGDGDGDVEVNSSVASVRGLGYGKYQLRLADGAIWNMLEASEMREPKSGDTVRIRRGAIGSYLMNVNGRRAMRVRRQN